MSENKTNINWYPGHMAKTRRQIENDLKLVDIVIEILDSRIPISSQNPDIQNMIKKKKHLVILNKCDLAEDRENDRWVQFFKKQGIPAILCNSKSGKGTEKIEETIFSMMEEEYEKASEKGRINKTTRMMIVGIPNVGKSSLINRMSKKSVAEVGNKPGVTKQKQWIRLGNNLELLDTPGVLWPKLEQESVALHLAYTGTIKSDIIEEIETAYHLVKLLIETELDKLVDSYHLEEQEISFILKKDSLEENEKIVEVMNLIGRKRGALQKGGIIDLNKTSQMILNDFKNGKLGKITIEKIK